MIGRNTLSKKEEEIILSLQRGAIIDIKSVDVGTNCILDFSVLSFNKIKTQIHKNLLQYEKHPELAFLSLAHLEKRKRALLYSHLCHSIRAFFFENEILEISTPILSKKYNGGLSKPFSTKWQDKDLYLKVTSEVYLKKMICTEMESVFEISKVFRNEGKGKYYYQEFPLLELYSTKFKGEEFLNFILKMLEYSIERVHQKGLVSVDKLPRKGQWRRISVWDYFRSTHQVDLNQISKHELINFSRSLNIDCKESSCESTIIGKLISKVIREKNTEPLILDDLPIILSPLFKLDCEKNKVNRQWIFFGNVDFCDLGQEENDPEILVSRLKAQEDYRKNAILNTNQDLINLANYGLPPIFGLGMSLSRLIMYLLDLNYVGEYDVFEELA